MKKWPLKWYLLTASFLLILSISLYFYIILKNLPLSYTLDEYRPPLITFVYDKNDLAIGEFFIQRRILTPFEKFPQHLIDAFISAEDSQFYHHKGINYKAIFRALLANIKAGRKIQGGSTITQQVAKSLLLSSKKTYTRKIKEALLAFRMEKHLSKNDILYLYLNQIYLGHGAYGVGMASKIYFKKDISQITLQEAALLAGLPQAPSRFSPISNAKKAKQRQKYVLGRMLTERVISKEKWKQSLETPLTIFVRENYSSKAPFVIETVRQLLTEEIGEQKLLKDGLNVYTSIDYTLQQEAQKQLKKGLKDLDKRQGYRGPLKNILEEEFSNFLSEREKIWISSKKNYRVINENGEDIVENTEFSNLKAKDQLQGIVTKVEDNLAYVDLLFSKKGVIFLETTQWARKPNKKVNHRFSQISSMSEALKQGDVIWIQIADLEDRKNKKLLESLGDLLQDQLLVFLEQEPRVQGALLSLDQETQDILAMVGGYDFSKSQFNRAYQAKRQTGSAFKPIIYSAALDKGFTPSSIISDEPVVFEDEEADLLLQNKQEEQREELSEVEEEKPKAKKEKWKPSNYSKHFTGDILFRNALIRSLNIPTVKLIEKIGIPWIEFYSRRLGIISDLNFDYTLALGSSSISLYEMTKAFSIFGRQGRQITPILIRKVENHKGEEVTSNISLDNKFKNLLEAFKEEFKNSWEQYWESQKDRSVELSFNKENSAPFNEEVTPEPQASSENKEKKSSTIFFENVDQVISPETAYLITSLLKGVIFDSGGTGGRARSLKRPMAGKTGYTNGYYDAWFIGYSPQILTGVWVGFDNEESLGQSETGSRAALPIWMEFMKNSHENLEPLEFMVPPRIIFANIDNETGYLAEATTKEVVKQAFIEGTEPKKQEETSTEDDDQTFLREDLAL